MAEGVENQEQLELLTSFGCTAIQGYYYSRPLEIAEFERNIKQAYPISGCFICCFQIHQV